MSDDASDAPHVFPVARKPGEMLFSNIIILFAGLLLAALPWQTAWIDGRGLAAQPRLWPALSLGGMAVFAALHLALRQNVQRTPGRWREGLNWVLSVEYIVWYVSAG
jgi:hypothetical protein